MANACINKIKMVFKDQRLVETLQADLNNLGDNSGNLYKLVFTDTKDLDCRGTYNLTAEDSKEDLALEYLFDTAWSPINEDVLLKLMEKYDLASITNNYWEPAAEIAGTQYSVGKEILDTEADYAIVDVDSVEYPAFVDMTKQHYPDELTVKQLKALYQKFKKYEHMYTEFESNAYKELADTEGEPMFNTFIANNL